MTSMNDERREPRAGLGRSSPVDILVVDDDPNNIVAFEVVMRGLDVSLTTARSGEEALRQLLRSEFAVVLIDVQMPDLDGFETASLIRMRERLRHVPIIFVTAYNQDEADMRRGYGLGAVDYLFKPIVPEILRAKVQVFVDLHKRTVQVAEQAAQLVEAEQRENRRRLEEERRIWEAQALKVQMEEQRRINAQLAEVDRRKDEFLAVLAHELRNPLAPIVTSLELIRLQQVSDPLVNRAHGAIERQVRHLTRLIDDLLDVARISRGKLVLALEPMDLRTAIDQAVEACESTFVQSQQVLVLEGPREDVFVDGDVVRLTQVISNLLNNAARYSDRGGRVILSWGVSDGRAFVTVRDRGRGISSDFLERVFDVFAQERDGGSGLGLGLTLVKQITELHGGQVEARSEGRGHGSEFVVRLPLLVDAARIERAPAVRTTGRAKKRLRIAVVEDDPEIRESLRSLLEHWGHDVTLAETGPTGLDLIVEERPQVAIVDIGLPGLDGYGVARKAREKMREETPRLIAMTGFGKDSDRAKAFDAGFDVHLVKPSTPDALLHAIEAGHEDEASVA
jgi:signal transduction histidine kinase